MNKFVKVFLFFLTVFLLVSCDPNNPSEASDDCTNCEKNDEECVDGDAKCVGFEFIWCTEGVWNQKTCSEYEKCSVEKNGCIAYDPSEEHVCEEEDYGNDDEAVIDCDEENIGKSCSLDSDCGKCMICTTGGKCTKGCIEDSDCTMRTGLKCNRALARCTNVFASTQACGEKNCPTGCCYGEKGLVEVKCLAVAEVGICGSCDQGEIYIPSDSKCVPAVCSTIDNDCPMLNSSSLDQDPACFKCVYGEFICKPDAESTECTDGE